MSQTFPTIEALPVVRLALQEDVGPGDLTSRFLVPADARGSAVFLVKADGVLAGLPVLQPLFAELDASVEVDLLVEDGAQVSRGARIARVRGPLRSLLTGERSALNFLQRLSGIATLTRAFVDRVAGTRTRILDTRKTTPGHRAIEKYAVRVGGGENHRMGLYDGVMVKDNHRRWLLSLPSAEAKGVLDRARNAAPDPVPVVIEVDSLVQLPAVLALAPDVVMFDNLGLAEMARGSAEVRAWNVAHSTRVETEASGGVTLDSVTDVARTGVDRISVGAITHSARALDISMEVE